MHAHIHTHLHTYIHTNIHTNIHTYIHTYTHTYIHTYTHTHIHTYTHTYIHTYRQTYIHTYRHTYIQYIHIWKIEGSLDVKLPTIWTDEKQSRAEAGRRERLEERRSEKRKSQKKEDADARKGRKVAKHCVFPMICCSGGSKSRRGASWPDERWKIARRCGAKHISKSKCTKHTILRPLLDVEMSKKCTPLWREAHFEVKMYKTPHVRATFGGSDVVSRGRRKGLRTLSKMSKTWGFCSIFNYNHHYTTLHSNTLHYTTTTPSLHSTTLNSTTLHCTQLHPITLHYITLHSTTLHYITLHYTTFHYTSLHYTTPPSTTLQL